MMSYSQLDNQMIISDDEDMDNDYAAGGCICAGAVGIVFLIFVASIIGVFLVIERVLQ